jgi:hypothetical protein
MRIWSSVGEMNEDLPLVYVTVTPVKLHVVGTGGVARERASVESTVMTNLGTKFASNTDEKVDVRVLISVGEISTVAAEWKSSLPQTIQETSM